VKNGGKSKTFPKRGTFLKLSPRQVECSIHNPTEHFLLNVRKRKRKTIALKYEEISSECSSGHVNSGFDNKYKKNSATRPKKCRSKSENDEKSMFWWKQKTPSQCSPGQVECSIHNPTENFSLKVGKL